MKLLTLHIAVLMGAFALPAFAADEFGARFDNEAPSALGSFDDPAAAFANMEPAAGDAEDVPAEQLEGADNSVAPVGEEEPSDYIETSEDSKKIILE